METTASLPLALYRARVEQVKAFFTYISRFVGFLAGAAIRLSGVQLFPCVLAIAAGRIARRPTAGGGWTGCRGLRFRDFGARRRGRLPRNGSSRRGHSIKFISGTLAEGRPTPNPGADDTRDPLDIDLHHDRAGYECPSPGK